MSVLIGKFEERKKLVYIYKKSLQGTKGCKAFEFVFGN
jgi:hypothetical protein